MLFQDEDLLLGAIVFAVSDAQAFLRLELCYPKTGKTPFPTEAEHPKGVFDRLNGVNVDQLRREGLLPPKGQCNIKGGKYMKGFTKTLGILGILSSVIDVYDAQQRADEFGVNVWTVLTFDLLGVPVDRGTFPIY